MTVRAAARPLGRATGGLTALLLALAACERRGEPPPPPAPIEPRGELPELEGPAAVGQRLFHEPIHRHPPCLACHEVATRGVRIGPPLHDIAQIAGQRRPELGAREYLRQSILEPDAFVVPGYSDEIMPESYGELLGEDEVEAMVDYLMTRTGRGPEEASARERERE